MSVRDGRSLAIIYGLKVPPEGFTRDEMCALLELLPAEFDDAIEGGLAPQFDWVYANRPRWKEHSAHDAYITLIGSPASQFDFNWVKRFNARMKKALAVYEQAPDSGGQNE